MQTLISSAQEKYSRWKDFATRMANTCYNKRKNPDLQWILEQIDCFFQYCIKEEDTELYVSWDEVKPYPEEHHYHGLDYQGTKNTPSSVCDLVSGLFDEIWSRPKEYATEKQILLLDYYWDKGNEEAYDDLVEKITDRWENPVSCCLRAGIDLAFNPSAGVLGFTAGELRQMYPEGVPEWISKHYKDFHNIPDNAQIVM